MDYGIFNVTVYVIILMRACTHGMWGEVGGVGGWGGEGLGVGHTDNIASQHNVFDSQKLSHCFLVPPAQAGFEPPIFGSRVRRSSRN